MRGFAGKWNSYLEEERRAREKALRKKERQANSWFKEDDSLAFRVSVIVLSIVVWGGLTLLCLSNAP